MQILTLMVALALLLGGCRSPEHRRAVEVVDALELAEGFEPVDDGFDRRSFFRLFIGPSLPDNEVVVSWPEDVSPIDHSAFPDVAAGMRLMFHADSEDCFLSIRELLEVWHADEALTDEQRQQLARGDALFIRVGAACDAPAGSR